MSALWRKYKYSTYLKREKSAKNVLKALYYVTIFCTLLPCTISIIGTWNDYKTEQSVDTIYSFRTARIVLTIVLAYYVFEICSVPKVDQSYAPFIVHCTFYHTVIYITLPTSTFFCYYQLPFYLRQYFPLISFSSSYTQSLVFSRTAKLNRICC